MPNTFTLVATQNGANMNYVIGPLVSAITFTSSFTIPVNPVPNNGVVSGGAPYSIGFAFLLSNPPLSANSPLNFLFNGHGVTPLLTEFFNVSNAGGIQVVTRVAPNQVAIYYLTGSQLYSGLESAPTMLAGTFTLTLGAFNPVFPNVYKVNYHFEISGKRSTPDLYNYVSASSQDYDSIAAVLANNNLNVIQNGVVVIDGVQIYNQTILT